MSKSPGNKPNAHELGTERPGKLLIRYSLPAIIAMAAMSLYNIIDRIFIGQGIGAYAISGLSLTLPLMNITTAFGAMVGVGASTLVSIRLGQHDRKGATQVLGNAVSLNLILGILVTVVTLIFLDKILIILGASNETLPYAKEFMRIILYGNVITHLFFGLNGVMRSSGYPRKAMYTTLITVAANIILAPLFIFVFHWGIQGAAWATVLSQLVGTAVLIVHFSQIKSFLHFLPGYMKLKFSIVKEVISIGMSNFIMLISASVVISIINISLYKYSGDFAIGAFGIINSISGLIFMIVIGFNQGMQPIVGYNFGAKKIPRLLRTFQLTVFAATIVTCAGFLLAEIIPHTVSSAFTTDSQLTELSTEGLRLCMLMFPIVGFQVVTSSFFQSIGKAKFSIFLALTRQVLFFIPILLILPHFWGLKGVWLSIPVSDFLSSLLSFIVLRWQVKKLKAEHLTTGN